MTSVRTNELRASLLRELEVAARRGNLAPVARLKWLRGELENYLERWLGFAALDDQPYPSLLRGDLFAMVVIATEVLETQFGQGGTQRAREEWRVFRLALDRARTAKDRSQLSGLRESLAAVAAALSV